MNASVVLLLCGALGSAVGYYQQRQQPYNTGPLDPYDVQVNSNYLNEPSQRLFWGNQGSNQVGGTGLWATLTNKFPFLGNMFGRMELPAQYGAPNQLDTQYGAPAYQAQYYQTPQLFQAYQPQPQYQAPQAYQPPQTYQQPLFRPRTAPFGRDVGFTDDAVIVTPPQVPVAQPFPVPQPAAPQPSPDNGYQYNKPQYRLELPQK